MAIDRNKIQRAAQKYIRKGSWDRAIREYRKLVEDDPSDMRSLQKIADLQVKEPDHEGALTTYRQVAAYYFNDQIYDKAVAVFKQALRLAPQEPDLHRHLGDSYHRLGRLKDAVRSFYQAERLYRARGDEQAQRGVLEQMVRLDQEDLGLRIQLAEQYARADLTDQAVATFEQAAERLAEEGRQDEFLQVAERMIFLSQDKAAELRPRVSRLYSEQQDHRRALRHLQILFKEDPDDVETLELLAHTFGQMGERKKSLMVYHELARTYERLGRQRLAEATYHRILEMNPRDRRARQILQPSQPLEDSGALVGSAVNTDVAPPAQGAPPVIPCSEAPATIPTYTLDEVEFLDEEEDEGLKQPAPARATADPPGGDLAELDLERLDEAPATHLSDRPQHRAPAPAARAQRATEESPAASRTAAAADGSRATKPSLQRGSPGQQKEERLSPERVEQMLAETRVFVKYGLNQQALALLERIVAQHPTNLTAREQLCAVYQATGAPRRAVEQLLAMAAITRAQPERCEFYLERASLLGAEPEELDAIRHADDDTGVLAAAEIQAIEEIAAVSLEELSDTERGAVDAFAEGGLLGGEATQATDIDPSVLFLIEESSVVVEELETPETPEESAAAVAAPITSEVEILAPADESEVPPATRELSLTELDPVVEVRDAAGGMLGDPSSMFEVLEEESEIQIDDLEDFDELGDFDDLSDFGDGADLVDVDLGSVSAADIDLDSLDEDTDAEVAAAMDLSVSSEEADAMFDGIFGGETELPPGAVIGLGAEFSRAGAGSLSKKFQPDFLGQQPSAVSATTASGEIRLAEMDAANAMNTNLELGVTYMEMGLYDEAIDEFTQALDDPDVAPTAHLNIARCELRRGADDAARARLTDLLDDASAPAEVRARARELLHRAQPSA